MSSQAPSGGFSLFPNTGLNRPPSRTQASHPRATTPQSTTRGPSPAFGASPPRGARQASSSRQPRGAREGRQQASFEASRPSVDAGLAAPTNEAVSPERHVPTVVIDAPPRCETAFSEAQTLVRSSSGRSRSSIAKRPFPEQDGGFEAGPSTVSADQVPGLRSIFPQYNPDLPLDRQDYYPTQASPTHIPRAAISRPLYSPNAEEESRPAEMRSPLRSPMSGSSTQQQQRWPPRAHEAPVVPQTSTTEDLKGLWRVTNGWKARGAEGRVYCMEMTCEADAPIYTLSSDTQPFYHLRLDPTSTSAYVSLERHDPSKLFKGPPPNPKAAGGGGDTGKSKGAWQEALSTTLEEEARKHQPNHGLVAMLYPTAAAKLALDRPGDEATVRTAEAECARLVWDDDSGNHFLVHPALAVPFCVTIERSPAWSRVEYTIEHLESPQHVARLTRDGSGAGWLEVDTAIAAKVDAVYLIDVAVAALMLVAHGDGQFTNVEVFAPPPVLGGCSPRGSVRGDDSGSRRSRMGSRLSGRIIDKSTTDDEGGKQKQKKNKNKKKREKEGGGKKRTRLEEFELDLESQTSDLKRLDVKGDKEKLPSTARTILKILSVTFKCFIWVATLACKTLSAIITGLARCLTSEKL